MCKNWISKLGHYLKGNTDHDGSISTGHANSAYDMLSRSETMVLMAEDLPFRIRKYELSDQL